MAKQSRIAVGGRRRRAVARYAPRSAELAAAVRGLSRLPRDASPDRLRNRDQVDGRPRGHLRLTGTSRIRFRVLAHRGELPGIRKSSW